MGIFKALGRGFGKVVEKIGDSTGSKFLSDAGRKIQSACAEKVGSEKAYDKREANINTTERLNEILVAFSAGYLEQAKSIEENCIRLVEDYYDKLIKIIEDVPSNSNSAANIRGLKDGKKKIARTITGGIRDPLAKRMSLDDAECLRILKMDPGDEKKLAMKNFTNKVIREALNNLALNVRMTLNEQTEDIQDYLNYISEEQEKTLQVLKDSYSKMLRDGELEQKDREKNCVVPLLVIDASQCVSQILK